MTMFANPIDFAEAQAEAWGWPYQFAIEVAMSIIYDKVTPIEAFDSAKAKWLAEDPSLEWMFSEMVDPFYRGGDDES